MAKYNSYSELAAAFKSGELDSSYVLVLDKGCTWNTLCRNPDESLSDEENDKRQDEAMALFDGRRSPTELFSALGIPTESA